MLHPLFPDKDCDISWILLTRHEPSGQVYHPGRWDPEELHDLAHVQEQFGGGLYEFIARDEKTIVARAKYKLPGASKPLVPEPSPVAQPIPMQQQQSGNASDQIASAVLQLIPVMMNAQAAQQQTMAAMFQAQAAQQTQFLTAMMQSAKQDGNALIQAMAELSKAQTQTMAEAMKGAQQNSGGSSDGALEALVTGFELGQKGADKPNDVAETIGAITQGISALQQSAPPKPNGAT